MVLDSSPPLPQGWIVDNAAGSHVTLRHSHLLSLKSLFPDASLSPHPAESKLVKGGEAGWCLGFGVS